MDNFIQIDLYTSTMAMDEIIDRLTALGIEGFEIRDGADFESFLSDKNANWDYVDDSLMRLKDAEPCVTVYVHDNEQGRGTLSAIKALVEELSRDNTEGYYGNLRTELTGVKEEDWANNWKQYYKPFRIGKSLIIKPSWEDFEPCAGEKILEIDPASTFGTGQHHTTKMVLETLEEVVSGGERVLDLGCGSGILSIAAMLFGAKSVAVCDIFRNAVDTASENIAKNGFGESCTAFCGNICDNAALREEIGGGYDIVCANIVADVIIGMSEYFAGFMAQGARLIVSGVIAERLEEVLEALEDNGFLARAQKSEDGWYCLLLCRE